VKTGNAETLQRSRQMGGTGANCVSAAGNSNGLGRRRRGAGAAPSSKCWEARERSKSGVSSQGGGKRLPSALAPVNPAINGGDQQMLGAK
jgi:hypothetical protein